MSIEVARDILKHRFGYDEFRLNQEQAITAVLDKRDAVVLMPTGGGKSVCYQIPALMLSGLTVVISPLIALMKDQVDALRANGVDAAFVNSTQTAAEQIAVFKEVRSGKIKLLYVAPERLLQSSGQFLEFLSGVELSLFAIDEAHCISSWGHDFRPEYLQLARLKKEFPGVPVIALTATADELVRKDILERLDVLDASVFISSFNRPNIYYSVEPKRNSYSQLLDYLEKRRDASGIIYCLSRNSVDSLAANLSEEGYSALPYHAGLDKETRQRHQELFLRDEAKIIVATIAFGMGIDKSNVRFVVHMDLPKNIESYYQETGRAGRDGLPSDALLFFSWGDVIKLKGFAEVEGNQSQSELMLNKLNLMGEFGELRTCRRRFLLEYFSEHTEADCGNCDNCNSTFERFDGTVIAQKALSAVYRTGQSFGVNYVIDLLRGSKAQNIRDEHKNLKTYGVGSDLSKDEWSAYFKDLIAQGYLAKTPGQYPTIVLTEKSGSVLSGTEKVELYKLAVREEKQNRSFLPGQLKPYFKDLFDDLRQLRSAIANIENVPSYIIFSDATLTEMATYLPLNSTEMRQISGVGDIKFEKYAKKFLDVLVCYCERNHLTSRINEKRSRRASKGRSSRVPKMSDTYRVSLRMFRAGATPAEIAAERGLNISTIENHLARFIPTGEIDLSEIVPESKVEPIRNAVLKFADTGALSPIRESLGDGYSYGEIKAVIASMQ